MEGGGGHRNLLPFLLLLIAQHSVVATYARHYSIVELGRSQVVGGVARGWGITTHKYVFMLNANAF